jgi:hypothetical protein
MRNILSVSIIFILSLAAKGQVYLSDPFNGKPYMVKAYDDIRGSAFLFDDWKPGHATDKYGTTFLNVVLRFDAYANKFFYNHGDTAYEFVTVINEFELFPFSGDTTTKMVFRNGFTATDKLTPDKFVQVLTEGKITAVKYLYKSLDEITEYNMPGKIKSFANRMTYFFIKDGTAISQKPSSKLLEELLKDKWPVVEPYMKQNSLSPKSEDDCVKIINYYNSL